MSDILLSPTFIRSEMDSGLAGNGFLIDPDDTNLLDDTDPYVPDNDLILAIPSVSGSIPTDDSHCHRPEPEVSKKARNQLIVVCMLSLAFMAAEITGGLISGSLALLTDATHLASDIIGFLIGLLAIWVSAKPATLKMTFGFHRAEVLGAMLSILIIWIVTGVLCYLAALRLINRDFEIKANEMLITASLGVVFNLVMGAILHVGLCKSCEVPHSHLGHGHAHAHGHSHSNNNNNETPSINGHVHAHSNPQIELSIEDNKERSHKNMNVRAAFIHVVGDFIQSVGVLVAAIIIKIEPKYKIADPICTFIFSVLVLFTTFAVLKDIVLVIMEAVPRQFNIKNIYTDLKDIGGVKSVHSLHIWALSMDKTALVVHLAVTSQTNWETALKKATKLLKEKHGLFHTTVQVENFQEDVMNNCRQCLDPGQSFKLL